MGRTPYRRRHEAGRWTTNRALADYKQRLIASALQRAAGIQARAAALLGVKSTTLNEKVKRDPQLRACIERIRLSRRVAGTPVDLRRKLGLFERTLVLAALLLNLKLTTLNAKLVRPGLLPRAEPRGARS